MKKISSLTYLIFLSVILWGQSETTTTEETNQSPFTYQIGTDISPLFRSLLKRDFNANNFLSTPYAFTFKSIKDNRAFRFGIGGNRKQEIGDDNSDDKILQNSFRIRMGFEKQQKISERWQINTGIDLKFSSSKFDNSNSSSFNNEFKSYGLSPLLGIQFQITPHLYLQTEASVNLFYSISSFESNFDIIFPGPNPIITDSDSKIFGGNITIPNALLLVVEF